MEGCVCDTRKRGNGKPEQNTAGKGYAVNQQRVTGKSFENSVKQELKRRSTAVTGCQLDFLFTFRQGDDTDTVLATCLLKASTASL